MLYTASFYTPEDWVDRLYRVSRGHPRGRRPQWETLPFLYPQRELLQAYRSGQMDFAAFEIEYRRGLDQGYEGLAEFRVSHRPVGELTNTGVGAMGLKRGRPVQFHWPLVGPQKGRLPLLVPWGLGPAPRGLATAP